MEQIPMKALALALGNGKTTIGAVALLALSLLAMFGVEVPGFHVDPGAGFAMAFGLLFAKDADKTGGINANK